MTLIELVIALAVTAIISAVLAILINATAMGTNSQQDGRRSLVKMEGMKAQIEDTIVNARCVLATGSNYIVLWAGDRPGAATPPNGAVNLSELELLQVDTASGNLYLYTTQWPASYTSANIVSADATYAANTTWYSACVAAESGSFFVPTVIGANATGMTVSLDSAGDTTARLVSLVVSFTDSSNATRQIVVGATIQNPAAPW